MKWGNILKWRDSPRLHQTLDTTGLATVKNTVETGFIEEEFQDGEEEGDLSKEFDS